jgi:hypothetical protein
MLKIGVSFQQKWMEIREKYLIRARILYMDESIVEILRWHLQNSPVAELGKCGLFDLRSLEEEEEAVEAVEKGMEFHGDHGEDNPMFSNDSIQTSSKDLVMVIWLTGNLQRYSQRIETLIRTESEKTGNLEVVVLTSVHEMIYRDLFPSFHSDFRETPFQKFKQNWLRSMTEEKQYRVRIIIDVYPWNVIELFEDVLIIPNRGGQLLPGLKNMTRTQFTKSKDVTNDMRVMIR